MPRYAEQLDRVRRWYTRLEGIHNGRELDCPSDYLLDDIHAFFQNCYHLKDWLIKDTAFTAKTESEIEKYIEATRALAICADICNAAKHLVLDRRTRSGSHPELGSRRISVNIGGPHQTIAIRVQLNDAGQYTDAFDLATDALRAWETFLSLPATDVISK